MTWHFFQHRKEDLAFALKKLLFSWRGSHTKGNFNTPSYTLCRGYKKVSMYWTSGNVPKLNIVVAEHLVSSLKVINYTNGNKIKMKVQVYEILDELGRTWYSLGYG